MPRTIKKRAPKETKKEVPVYEELKETIAERQKSLVKISVIVLIIVALAAGIYLYHSSTVRQANNNNAKGYSIYYGLSAEAPASIQQRYSLALSDFQKAYDAKKSAYSLYYIGASQYALGQYAPAINTMKQVYENYPGDAEFVPLSLYKSAMAALKMGKPDDALKYLSMMESSQYDSLKDMAYYEDAGILESMGKKDEANRKIDDLIRAFPQSQYAMDFKAQREAQTGAKAPQTPTAAPPATGKAPIGKQNKK